MNSLYHVAITKGPPFKTPKKQNSDMMKINNKNDRMAVAHRISFIEMFFKLENNNSININQYTSLRIFYQLCQKNIQILLIFNKGCIYFLTSSC